MQGVARQAEHQEDRPEEAASPVPKLHQQAVLLGGAGEREVAGHSRELH